MTIEEWLALQGYQSSANFNGGLRTVDPGNTNSSYYDQVSGGMYSNPEFSFDYTQLPGYEQFVTRGTGGVSYGGADPIPDKFDWAGWSAANPGYTLQSGNLGGRSGIVDYALDPSGSLVGNPTFNQNTALSDLRNMALVIAGGYLGGSAAFGGGSAAAGGAAAGAEGGAAAGGAAGGGLSSAELAALYGDAGYGAGMTGAETAAYGAGGAGATGASGAGSSGGGSGGGMSGNSDLYAQLGQAALQQYFNNRARNDMLDAGRESNELLRYMYEQNRSDNAPLMDLRNATLPRIQGLMDNPGSITSDPGYQFGLNQGTNALNRGAAARGMTYSGAQQKALTEYGQDYAGTKLNDSLNRLMGVAGLGQVGANANQNNNSNYAQNAGNNLQQMGNVRGSSYMNSGNIWGNALGSWYNNQQFRDLNNGG